ncbi:radical SAM protein [bacterium]|nr:radical SAM protein [bacterium]
MKIGLTIAVNPELDKEWSFHQPLGIGYISSYLRKYSPHVSEIVIERDLERLIAAKPDIVGIGCVSYAYSIARQYAQRVKEALGCPVWLGGPHITSLVESLTRDFDLAVIGEGEQCATELVEAYASTGMKPTAGDLAKIQGIAFWDNGGMVRTEDRELLYDMDVFPIPDRHLMDGKWGDNKTYPTIMTSRGCPYKCTFCATIVQWGRKFRGHSAEYVCAEIEHLRNTYDCENVLFYDDLFIANKKRFKEIVLALEERGLLSGISTRCFVRVNLMDDEMCDLLARMNCNILYTGFESNSAPILQELGKTGVKPEHNQKMIDYCRKYGFEAASCFIIGSPSERREDILATYQFICENADTLQGCVVTPLMVCPGTQVWRWAVERGLCSVDNLAGVVIEPEDFDEDYFMRNRYIFLNKHLDREEFLNLLKIGRSIAAMVNNWSAVRWAEKERQAAQKPIDISARIREIKAKIADLKVS